MSLLSDRTTPDLGAAQRNFERISRFIFRGRGSPEGVVAAPVGAHFQREDGGPGTAFYVKETGGSGKTGWTAK